MTGLSKAIVAAVFMSLILGVGSDRTGVYQTADASYIYGLICDNNPFAPYLSICSTTTTIASSTSTSTQPSTTTEDIDFLQESSSSDSFSLETSTESSSISSSPSPLQRAYWCQFTNGTYIPLGYTFMYTGCALCQCQQSRDIRCTTLSCMPTYCIDDSAPTTREGQCCSQCIYDPAPTSCVQNGISFLHGTIIKSTTSNLQCWCQLGSIECRTSGDSIFSGLDLWGAGTAMYVIIVIVMVMLLLGTLLCCGCTLLYYYYYKHNQQAFQEAYDQYFNNGGWQPVNEEGYVVDDNAEEKQTEAEKNQFEYEYPTGNSEAYIPPPYALYDGSYVVEEKVQDQKHL